VFDAVHILFHFNIILNTTGCLLLKKIITDCCRGLRCSGMTCRWVSGSRRFSRR